MVYKLIIFDFDNTIVKPTSLSRKIIAEIDHYDIIETMYTSFISSIGSIPYISMFKRPVMRTIEMLSKYEENIEVADFIRDMNDYRMAIFSSNSRQIIEWWLGELRILEKFDGNIISGEDIKMLKPFSNGLWKILRKCRVQPREAIYFGCSQIDRETSSKIPEIKFIPSLDDLKQVLYMDRRFAYQ